jgi:hypothetical protein
VDLDQDLAFAGLRDGPLGELQGLRAAGGRDLDRLHGGGQRHYLAPHLNVRMR